MWTCDKNSRSFGSGCRCQVLFYCIISHKYYLTIIKVIIIIIIIIVKVGVQKNSRLGAVKFRMETQTFLENLRGLLNFLGSFLCPLHSF